MHSAADGGSNMNRKKPLISVIVIAKNEEARIGKCLDAVTFADELIVLDNSSEDDTAVVAKAKGALVRSFHSGDFAKLRNIAAAEATGEWILYVDADEIVTPELAASIQQKITSGYTGKETGFEIHRKNYYLGVLWPAREWMLRLFRRDAFKEWRGTLHETPIISGETGRITGDLLHDTHRTLKEMVTKTNEWSQSEATLRLKTDHPAITWWRILRVVLTGFWASYIRQGGWRAGTVGWIESMYQGFSMFITYSKLWELQQKNKKHL